MSQITLDTLDEASAQRLASDKGLPVGPNELISRGGLAAACRALGDEARASLIHQGNEHAWTLERELKTRGAVTTSMLAAWFATEERVAELSQFVLKTFGAAAQLVERQGAQLRFKLPGASAGASSVSLSDAFKSMESNKAQLHIREYALSQTTLEQIFNRIASKYMDMANR